MKMKTKLRILISLAALAILAAMLSSCQPGIPKYDDIDYHKGSEGLSMIMTNEASLDEIYEGTNFVYSLTLENRGAYDVEGDNQAILAVGFDPYYLTVTQPESQGKNMVFGKSNIIVKQLSLMGKSRYYPSGSKVFFYFPYFKTKEIEGQRSKPETQIFSSLCYPYSTTLSAMACIDFDIYHENTRSQVCTQQDISSSNQGAPVAITQVEVENLPTGSNMVRPVFTVHVQNIGDGTILSPVDNSAEVERVCTDQQLSSTQDFNQVGIDAWLSNNIKLECTPNKIRMTETEGLSRCVVKDEDLEKAITWRQNYLSPLTVNLTYIYMSTIRKNIQIKRINPYGDLSSQATGGCSGFQITQGDKCINKCDYCAEHPQDAMCSPPSARFPIQWNSGFGCRCSASTCDNLYPKGLCVPFSAFCPPASYCCSNACSASEIRGAEDGKCYPKCTTSCTKITAPCVCGDDIHQSIASAGDYCSKGFSIYKDKAACDAANKEDAQEPPATA
jgi:hypothetical protein